MELRFSDNDVSKRDIPSFIEPRPPLIQNPFMRPRPQKGTNLLELFEDDSEIEEPDLVQVYLRMKPHQGPNNLYEVRSDKCLVTSLDTTTAGHGRRTQHNVSRMYTFSRIFDGSCSQKEIFEQVVKDNLKRLPEGQSFTLLTYGASGSGKTYTLMGTVSSPGLVPRSLEYVFKLVDAAQQPAYKPSDGGADKLSYVNQEFELKWVKQLRYVSAPQRDKYRRMSAQLRNDMTVSTLDLTNRTKYYVWVSFVEIYNEAIYDLLAPPDKRTKLRIREDSTGQVYVKGVTQAFVRTGEEAYDVMVAGKHNLVVAATGVHAHSSRSHCIFTITMLTETDGEIRTSCVRLCDLAGCERARATRNTGARMQESRAINSSLHVLERCLHMLRRNQKQRQEALVPYRESKLTRLLGSGLSGSRGEAVSMVVTLNPSPQYAQETKHVLSLAAVAQDIQINNTMMYATQLESSAASQDTTICSSTDVMKLRSDNERLHFELVQAQARNKELLAAMEEKQEQSANTMRELVEEAKDMTRQYYEAQIDSLRSEMEDMIEEYEARLAKTAAPPIISTGTPTRFLQAKVAHLMTEIAMLEDKLSAEKLSRERAEKEVQHLRTCIEERDEKAYKDSSPQNQEEVVLTDSEDEPSDPFNQSLEPVFRMECMNRSQAVKNEAQEDTEQTVKEDELSDGDKSSDTIKHGDYATPKNSDYETGDESEMNENGKNITLNFTNAVDDERKDDMVEFNILRSVANEGDTIDDPSFNESSNLTDVEQSEPCNVSATFAQYHEKIIDEVETKGPDVRGTYFVRISAIDSSTDEVLLNESNKCEIEQDNSRGTYFVKSTVDSSCDEDNTDKIDQQESEPEKARETYFVRKSLDSSNAEDNNEVNIVAEEMKHVKLDVNISETQISHTRKVSESLVNKIIKSLKKSTQGNKSDSSLKQFEFLELAAEECHSSMQRNSEFGNLPILKEKRKYFDENDTIQFDANDKTLAKIHNKNTNDEVETMISSNKTKELNEDSRYEKDESNIGSCKNLERHYDSDCEENKTIGDEILISNPFTEKRTYFDNIKVSGEITNKIIKDIKETSRKYQERSPSIVKDDIETRVKPSTMKTLLGENIAKYEILSSIHKNRSCKHDSIDVFEGLESPHIVMKENEKELNSITPSTPNKNKLNSVDKIRKSIDKLVLEQRTRNIKQETPLDKNESCSSGDIEEPVTVKKSHSTVPRINVIESVEKQDETQSQQDNTIEQFEHIYRELSTIRPTEFDLLAAQETEPSSDKDTDKIEHDPQSNLEVQETIQDKTDDKNTPESLKVKYNLRNKGKSIVKSYLNVSDETQGKDEVIVESSAKCESKAKNKRCLRLRKRKNVEEESDQDNDKKLQDLVNLKKDFSDVTMGLPVFKKEVKDIPSPEDVLGEEENLPPLGIQSCPSKSVTRSRRKLFTPRAEPLEESMSHTGDSTERIRVPRPSYHRTRVRRKL